MTSARSPVSPRPTQPVSKPVPALRIGHRYEVVEQLGRGGTAIVYRVRDASHGGAFALKQLVQRGAEYDREIRELFEREYCVLAQLSHPSVIEVHDFGTDLSGPYYTMELLDSGDLAARAPWPYETACQLMGQVCSALALLHARRLVHRDISPRNIRLTALGTAKLIDFGAMVPMGPCTQVVGTPGFVAPEVIHQLALDARTDLFSLGATLYHALTDRKPFAARNLSELNDAWREEPPPPSHFVPGIPAALDALVLSLLCIDPAGRPRTSFEVMQRLMAIGSGNYNREPEQIAQAYLSTPALVGRDVQMRRFRQRLSAAMQGTGAGAVVFDGEPGLGRSRLLDACVIEAKLAGATVLNVRGRALLATPLAGAYALTEQLLEKLPDIAARCAHEVGVAEHLFAKVSDAGTPRLRAFEELADDRYAAREDLSLWLRAVCEEQSLVLAVDDLERIDQASIAWLAVLQRVASRLRMLIVATLQSATDLSTQPALKALLSHATQLTLSPLSGAQTEALFASIFSDAPQVALVSHRVQRLAAGNLRQSMMLARYMLERRVIRYADGNWVLPSELAFSDLPTSVEETVRECVAALSALARRFAETQALALEDPWSRGDYLALASPAEQSGVDDALRELVSQGVLVSDGSTYTLSHLGVRSCLVAALSEVEQQTRHLALAQLCVQSRRPILVQIQHRLLAGSAEQGLDLLTVLLAQTPRVTELFEPVGDRRRAASILEHAYALASALGRPVRELNELSRRLLELSVTIDDALYDRNASRWLAQLERDSGFADYGSTEPAHTSAERMAEALQIVTARYADTPARDRGYDPSHALKHLCHFVAISTVIAARTSDTRLYALLPHKLEPFARSSPLVDALHQAAVAAEEMNCKAQPVQAHARMREVHARLERVSRRDFEFLDTVTSGVAQGVAVLEVTLGYPRAEQWLEIMERDPRHKLSGLYLRRMLCIFDGDAEGADRYRKQAELLAIQTDGYGSIPARLSLELAAHLHAGDLTGVKHVADRTEQLSIKAPGWLALHSLAQASFQRMRGDLSAARLGLERALALAEPHGSDPPPQLNVWVLAAAEYVTCLTELDRAHEARSFGATASERCEALSLTGTACLVRALAVAEARAGDHSGAALRLDRLIEQRNGIRPSLLAADYEARARVAMAAQDAEGAARYASLATSHLSGESGEGLRAKYAKLVEEARHMGLALAVPVPGLESALLGKYAAAPQPVLPSHVLASIDQLPTASARAMRALELLVQAAGAGAGHLYLAQPVGLVRSASMAVDPELALDAFVSEYLNQQLELAAMTTVFTQLNATSEHKLGGWAGVHGKTYRIGLLQCTRRDMFIGAIAFCDAPGIDASAEYRSLSDAISDRLLAIGDASHRAGR